MMVGFAVLVLDLAVNGKKINYTSYSLYAVTIAAKPKPFMSEEEHRL